jgi:hypothetical protein
MDLGYQNPVAQVSDPFSFGNLSEALFSLLD